MSEPPAPDPGTSWNATPPPRPGPAAGLEYGGFGVRVLAWILDAIILGVITAALGRWAVERVVRTLVEGAALPVERMRLEPTLVVRGSTAPAA